MDDFFGFLKKIAPTVAGFVGTPAAGIAVEALINAFDGDEEKANAIMRGETQLTSDDIARIKIAEIQAATRAKELDITLEQLHQADRESARNMNESIQGQAPSWLSKNTGYLLDFVAVCGAGYFTYLLFFGAIPMDNKELFMMAYGSMWTLVGVVYSFHRGTSAGSARKTEMLGAKP